MTPDSCHMRRGDCPGANWTCHKQNKTNWRDQNVPKDATFGNYQILDMRSKITSMLTAC